MEETNRLLAVGVIGVVLGALLTLGVLNYSAGVRQQAWGMMGNRWAASGGFGGRTGSMMGSGTTQGYRGMMGKAYSQDALDAAKQAGWTEQQLKDRGDRFMDSMMGEEAHAQLAKTLPPETNDLMNLRMGVMTLRYGSAAASPGN